MMASCRAFFSVSSRAAPRSAVRRRTVSSSPRADSSRRPLDSLSSAMSRSFSARSLFFSAARETVWDISLRSNGFWM